MYCRLAGVSKYCRSLNQMFTTYRRESYFPLSNIWPKPIHLLKYIISVLSSPVFFKFNFIFKFLKKTITNHLVLFLSLHAFGK